MGNDQATKNRRGIISTMKSMLVAYDRHYGIGANNDLLWQRDLPADLKRFKDLTMGNGIIMGWNTYESIGRPLPKRQNIVMSRSLHEPVEGVVFVSSLDEAYAAVDPDKDAFVIGGGQIYALALDTVDRIYATEVDELFENADIFFPKIDPAIWAEVSREVHHKDEHNKYDYSYVIYDRKKII